MHKAGLAFLRTELETAMFFLAVAEKAVRGDKRKRNLSKAHQAYDALLRFRPKVKLTREESAEIDEGMTKLRSTFERLGEHI